MRKKYTNLADNVSISSTNIFTVLLEYCKKHQDSTPKFIPVEHIDIKQLTTEDNLIYKLGHSSLLLKITGKIILVDPIFAKRVSPISWLGPKRFHEPPISLDDLPPIDLILITHNHYDHLDKSTLQHLNKKTACILTPLGIKHKLVQWGIAEQKIHELNWWQDFTLGELTCTLTPSQHFSGRTLFDGNTCLWGSWLCQFNGIKIFCSGDSGYSPHFKEIGAKYGPVDIAILENGAYSEYWKYIHMFPEQTYQAALDLQAKYLLPIHNCTFNLAFHPWYEPLNRISDLTQQSDIQLLTPKFGEAINILQPQKFSAWWKELI